MSIGLAECVSLLGDVSEAAPELRPVSSDDLCSVLSLVETPLAVQQVPPQLVSTLLVSCERSSALVQLGGK